MWVYIGTSELKNVYIGEVYEYSYDFRNKTLAWIQSDWWSLNTTSSVSVDSNWIRRSVSDWGRLYRTLPSLSSANRIVYNAQIKSNWWWYWHYNRIWDLASWWGISDATGLYSNDTKISIQLLDVATDYNVSISSGTYTVSMDFDLKNKLITYTFSWKWTYTKTLTDSDVTAIRGKGYLWIWFASSVFYVQTMSIKIE